MRSAIILAGVLAAVPALAESLPLNPDVTQSSIYSTICLPGYTKTIRPPVSYTNRIKKQRMAEMGLPLELIGDFQLDHKLPLSLGGHPSDPTNLVMQDEDEAHIKDHVEACLPRAVCAGLISLREAQTAIWNDWRRAERLCQ